MTIRKMLMAAAAALAISATAAKADLVFATDTSAYPPFTSQNAAGQWEGWEYDLMNALCAEMNEKCTMIPIAWDGIIPALLEKKMDGILGSMSITDKRKEQIDFSDMYYNSAAVIIGAKTGDLDISPEHLSGKTIGVQGATTHQNYIEKYYVPKGATTKSYQKQDEANADLAAGRVDYLLADGVALRDYLHVRRRQGLLRIERRRARGRVDIWPWRGRWIAQGRHCTQGQDQRRHQVAGRQRRV